MKPIAEKAVAFSGDKVGKSDFQPWDGQQTGARDD